MSFVARLGRIRALLPSRRSEPPEAELWSRAVSAAKASATAAALVLFVLGLTLDDMHLFRVSMAYVGAIAAVLAYALLPPILAHRLVRRAQVDSPEAPGLLLETSIVRRRAGLGLTVVLFVLWLVLFSSGVTPRW